MSEKQKCASSLKTVTDTCNIALVSLSSIHIERNSQNATPPELAVLHNDFLSILSIIYASVTKLSLALKPSSPTYSASLHPLQEIITHLSALVHCVNLCDPEIHGQALREDFISVAKELFSSLKALAQVFLDFTSDDTHSHLSVGQAGEEYMVRTGAVHDVIETARSHNGLSHDNISAVRKRWVQYGDSLQDGLREVREMIEDEDENLETSDPDTGDGWDELGLSSGDKMSADELERTKKVYNVLKLSNQLHKHILRYILVPPKTPPSALLNRHLDKLWLQSSNLPSASDELVATLYTPQDPSSMRNELHLFSYAVRSLKDPLEYWRRADQDLAGNGSEAPMEDRGDKDTWKWFDACFRQVDKAVDTLSTTLDTNQAKSAES